MVFIFTANKIFIYDHIHIDVVMLINAAIAQSSAIDVALVFECCLSILILS